ncbi:hypothetical protein D9M68_899530 [compost metagenome]
MASNGMPSSLSASSTLVASAGVTSGTPRFSVSSEKSVGMVSSKPAASSSSRPSQGWAALRGLRCSGVAGKVSSSSIDIDEVSSGTGFDALASARARARRRPSTG